MTLQDLTLEISAERVLTHFDSKRLVDWAYQVLEMGFESENVCILAGLGNDSTEEREEYFFKSLNDLNLTIEENEDVLIRIFALSIAHKAILGEISIEYAFGKMNQIVFESDYDYKYIAFYEIDEDLEYLKYDNNVIFNYGLTVENSKEFILEEFKIFVEMEDLNVPKEERKKCYCEKCKRLNRPITKNKFQFKKPHRYMIWSCEYCGSEKLKYNNQHEVKRMIIDEFRKNNPK